MFINSASQSQYDSRISDEFSLKNDSATREHICKQCILKKYAEFRLWVYH